MVLTQLFANIILIKYVIILHNFYFVKFFINLINLIIIKFLFLLIYSPIVTLLLILSFCVFFVLIFNNIYSKEYWIKLEKLKNFCFASSVFILMYIYLLYIFFFFKNGHITYIYIWVAFYKEMLFSLDLILGIDIITIYFLLLTSLIFPLIFYYITFYKKIFNNNNDYTSYNDVFFILFLIYFFLVLTFLSLNFFYFFVFFECTLITLFLLINFGGLKKKKYHASYTLFFFTLFGSVLILTAMFILFINFKTLNIEILMNEKLDLNTQKILVILLFFGFSVKIPIMPFYNWLPEAHVEASAIGSVLLASILLKVGSYGILRFMLPIFKEGIEFFFNFFAIFSVLSILISSFLAFMQTDIKKIIAYSSIAHMNYITIGLLSYSVQSIIGSIFYMISHAFISSALFFIIGIIYENTGSRELINLNNINLNNPILTFFFFIFNFANIAFPLSSSFIAELLILSDIWKINAYLSFMLIICLFFSSLYTLWILHNLLFGKLFNKQKTINLQFNEFFILFFLFLMVLLLGICSNVLLSNLELSLLFYLKYNYTL